MGITRRGFLQAAAGTLVLRCVLRVSAAEGPRGLLSLPHPQYARPLGGGAFLVTWITEGGLSRLSVVSESGTRDWARTGAGAGDLLHPQGVCVDEDGIAYVCDSRNGRVAVFDADGEPSEPVGRIGFLPGQFHLPQGCDVRGSLLAVADTQNHRVQLIDTLTREVQQVIGRLGDGDEEFRRPTDVVFEDNDTLLVLDSGHGLIKCATVEGRFLSHSPTLPAGGWFAKHPSPHGVGAQGLVLTGGLLAIADTPRDRVLVLDRAGRPRQAIEGLASPRGLCRGDDGAVVVCESGANRLSVFSME